MPLRVAFHTLGCKLNQFETESLADAFARGGAAVLPFDAEDSASADLIVVNTCTVTGKAERNARRIVRLALAVNPDSAVIITGCYAQVEAAALAAMGERVLVLPGRDKAALLGLPARLALLGDASGDGVGGAVGSADLLAFLREWLASAGAASSQRGAVRGEDAVLDGRFAYNPASFAFHSRPALKIQDGCDNDCAYCRVHIARGRAASLPAQVALARARALEEAGRAEIVLAGVNLSQYRDGDRDLPGLLRFLVAGTERIAFRLSSYEPDRVDSSFLEAFAHPRVRPHVHLAVQSGADPVLRAMGRRYGRAEILAAAKGLRRAKLDPFIAADIIAGFPGETEADAEATLELARDCGFAWIHAFRFSPRPGTRAVSMAGAVPERVARERVDALLELGRAARSSYLDRWAGKELSAILEVGLGATSENYLKLRVRGLPESARPGQEILCRIEDRPEERPGTGRTGEFDALALYISPLSRTVP
jgi:threonylcarbamoyladenosine tRNA methylthiotransferase MtaB